MSRFELIMIPILVIFLIAGCSGKSISVVSPSTLDSELNHLTHMLSGTGVIEFDPETESASIAFERQVADHLNVVSFVPSPGIILNYIDSVNWIASVDVTISNPYPISGYDVRLIIFTDATGHNLANADDWTPLYDIADGLDVNPFKAYAKQGPHRVFAGETQHTENLLIRIPGGNYSVRFAIDASYPNNAPEPYEISQFSHDALLNESGSSNSTRVMVDAWNNDINMVKIACPAVIGPDPTQLTRGVGKWWDGILTNNEGAPQGDYTAWITATTDGGGLLALVDKVNIHINGEVTDATYVGAAECQRCHDDSFETWPSHGHAFALSKIDSASPELPFTEVPNPPDGYSWNDISYLIGGYKTSAVFVDNNGKVILGPDTQWVLKSGHFGEYESPVRDVKDFDCGECHATGWKSYYENGGFNQDGLAGILGTWAATGVECEACHGPGSSHVKGKKKDIVIDRSPELCGKCHGHLDEARIYATNDFLIKNAQQYNEFKQIGAHHNMGCSECHDSHAGSVYDDQAFGEGRKSTCIDCHGTDYYLGFGMSEVECIDCHMPYGVVLAESTGAADLHQKGDIRTHIIRVDTEGTTLGDYFETDGDKVWIKPDRYGNISVNLAYACFQCHDGNSAFELHNYTFAGLWADGIHER